MNEKCHETRPSKIDLSPGPLTAASLIQNVPIVRPEFIRLPAPGSKCPWCGLSRSGLNDLILGTESNSFKPLVRSHVLRKRGARTGVRLIDFDSLMTFLRSLPAGTEAPIAGKEGTV